MKIYTKTGDDGSSGLMSGQRVRKNDPRLDCYGTVDELSAGVGLAAVVTDPDLTEKLRQIQNELLTIGSHVAMIGDEAAKNLRVTLRVPPLDGAQVTRLEAEIDAAESQLPPLREFILSGGSEAAARLHLARTICRRTERAMVDLASVHSVSPIILTYVNRLSDWLFVHARLANHRAGVADVIWKK
jgi:cob(I)alamin adenosyltransferase